MSGLNFFTIPLIVGTPQTVGVSLGGNPYQLTFLYRNDPNGGWTVDIDDVAGNQIVHGIPLVTGANLLRKYAHLGFGAGLMVQTSSSVDAVPTFANLGGDAQVYVVSPQ